MKKTNKGFSLVELIIVIAIMAILAGALAPALIKYINKSRLSTDVQTASSIATACQAAIATESGYDAAVDNDYADGVLLSEIYGHDNACARTIIETISGKSDEEQTAPAPKAKKCLGEDATGAECTDAYNQGDDAAGFKVYIDADANKITIEVGGHQLYPNADTCITG